MSDKLHQLIHSLSQTEKAYFKKNHTISKGSKKLLLFDYLNSQNEYDVDDLAKFGKRKGYSENLGVIKLDLYNDIIKSMRGFHADSSVTNQLHLYAVDYEFLFKKGLYQECLKLTDKAIALADENELYQFCVLIRNWKMYVLLYTQDPKIEKPFKKALNEIFELLPRINTSFKLYELNFSVWLLTYNQKFDQQEKQMKLDNIVSQFDQGSLKSILQQSIYLNTIGASYIAVGNPEKGLEFMEENVATLENSNQDNYSVLNTHIANLLNTISLALTVASFEKVQFLIDKLDKLQANYKELKNSSSLLDNIKVHKLCYSLNLANMKHDEKAAMSLIKQYQLLSSDTINQAPISSLFAFKYHCARTYFLQKEFETAQQFLTEIFYGENDPQTYKSTFANAKILELIIHFEQGHESYLPKLSRSLQRYIQQHHIEAPFYLTELIKLFHQPTYKLPEAWLEFNDFLKEKPNECRRELHNFDILGWVEPKV